MRWTFVWMVVVFLVGTAWAAGNAGDVDTTFGSGGIAVLPLGGGPSNGIVNDVERQTDGKLVVVGNAMSGSASTGAPWRVARVDADGQLDAGFGSGGVVTLFGDRAGAIDMALATHVDAGGGIWAAGDAAVLTGNGKKQRWTTGAKVVRLTATGSLDGSFGDAGVVDLAGDMDQALALAPLGGGDMLVVGKGPVASGGSGKGKKGGGSSSTGIVVARLNPDGSLDSAYGDDGFARFDPDPSTDDVHPTIHGAALQSDDSLVVLVRIVWPSGFGMLLRFTPSGDRDTAFAEPALDAPATMAIDTGDDIYVAGKSAIDEVTITRFDPDGALDASYGSAGTVTITNAVQIGPFPASGLALGNGTATLGLMEGPVSGVIDTFAVRLLDDGTLDPSYGPLGDGVSERLDDVAGRDALLGTDGSVVVGGTAQAGAGPWVLARFCGD